MNRETMMFNKRKIAFQVAGAWKQIVAGTVLCAILGSLIYAGCLFLFNKHREYQADFMVYLDYTEDLTEVSHTYNGYTWGQILASDLMMETILADLGSEYTDAEVVKSTYVTLEGDLRILTGKIHHVKKERCEAIYRAVVDTFLNFDAKDPIFADIRLIDSHEVSLESIVYFPYQAALGSALGGLILMLLGAVLFYGIHDMVLFSEECNLLFDCPCLAQTDRFGKLLYEEEAKRHLAGLTAENTVLLLTSSINELQINGYDYPQVVYEKMTGEEVSMLGNCENVLLCIPAGRMSYGKILHILDSLGTDHVKVTGMILTGAKCSLLKEYYRG